MKKKIYESYCSMTQWVKRQIRNPRKRLVLEAVAVVAIIIAIISWLPPVKKSTPKESKKGFPILNPWKRRIPAKSNKKLKKLKEQNEKLLWKAAKSMYGHSLMTL